MARGKLDTIDLKILAQLQANGRMTNLEVSRRIPISAPICWRRTRTLEKAGYIYGYHADLNAKALGYCLMVFAFVALSTRADTDLKAFEEKVRCWPQVRECYMVSGGAHFILFCVTRDLAEFQTFVTDTLTAAKNVASVKTALSIRASKHEPGIPLDT